MKTKILLLVLTAVAMLSCKENKIANTKKQDYSEFIYELPDSKYDYDVKIIDISTEIVKNAFKIKEDIYSVETTKNGYNLYITITITNPYDKQMNNIPFPEKICIASTDKQDFTDKGSYKKRLGQILKPIITDGKNNTIESTKTSVCPSYQICTDFKPKETKTFKLKFDSPIFENIKKITLIGYRLKIEYDEDEMFLNEIGLIIDVDKKKVIGEQKF